jgi:hypothetical protein
VRAFELADKVTRRGYPHQIQEIHYDDATGYTLYTNTTEIRFGYDKFDERIERLMIVDDILESKNIVASYILVDADTSLDRIVVKPKARLVADNPVAAPQPELPPDTDADASSASPHP